MKRLVFIMMIVMSVTGIIAQNEVDALRYSQSFYQGTARSMAMGNAFGALGADFSSLSTNPAGLGLYRSSEFSITPEFFYKNTQSTYNGEVNDDSRSVLAISNLGFVVTNKIPSGTTSAPWKYYQFAVGMNRTNNFNNNILIEGDNHDHSKIDVYLDKAYGIDYQIIGDENGNYTFDLFPAWYVYLLDTIPGFSDIYTSPVPQGGIRQREIIENRGSTNEWLFSAGANLNDRVFFGATLGLPYLRYFRTSTFSEYDVADTIPGFDEWTYKENVTTIGWGVNLKLGVIVWPVDWLRLGAAFHTPSAFIELEDFYSTTTSAQLGPDFNVKSSPNGEYTYDLTTPLKAIGSIGLIIGKYGLISGDYEFVDYSKTRLRAPDYTFTDENNAIKNSYQSTYNLRLGTEWRYTNFSFRGGYSLYGSPYADKLNDGKLTSYSLGLGYTEGNIGIDLAWVHSQMKQDYYLYSSTNFTTNPTNQQMNANHFALTIKSKF
ncbi:MAG: hypothetical protein Q8S18_05390 [Bacteroidales bacterium]|nr:hypothetical protein [Bacteroidales bacterium]